ncbi:MAG: hypothetical protein A3H98_03620 [Bacteroidetes bacterium RIFCSPLOWO2_02_FULL_36_8]|nr:MAG: hypothetical protein A3H98_03620 [Bacteroidetes bacterium RIFCSPLOWO2_02_FULL_36_8]OFY69530.1 MAG: hypothetical protein A3G23_10865 [Bacteroidetes bacterium RIFCSPLOWO2_12_FULL_37_12]
MDTQQISMETPAKKRNINKPIWFIVLVITVLISYGPCLKNGFTNWDDNHYIQRNPYIKSLNVESVTTLFSKIYFGNYHPVTSFSYMVEYHFFDENPFPYHFNNLLFHLINTLLIVILINLLTGNFPLSICGGLFFGIHPFHVESVAWISSRKDVLFMMFAILTFIFYLKFMKSEKKLYYFIAFVWFILSCLSKAMAMTIPLILFVFDFLQIHSKKNSGTQVRNEPKKKKLNYATLLLNKIPFLLVSVIIGIVAIKAQESAKALFIMPDFTILERGCLASYSILQYMIKLIFPWELSAFYPYPTKTGEQLPYYFWLFPVLIISCVACIIFFRKKIPVLVTGGLVLFIVALLPVLQFLPVGGAIMSDRYSYLPSLGFFIAVGPWLYDRTQLFLKKNKSFWILVFCGLIIYTGYFIFLTREQCKIWKTSFTLWNHVMERFPDFPDSYNNRGDEYYRMENYELALKDFLKTVQLKPDYALAWENCGNAHYRLGFYKESVEEFKVALKLNPDNMMSYYNRGLAFSALGEFENAVNDFDKAITMQPDYASAWNNRGDVYYKTKHYRKAISDFTRALELDSKLELALYNRGCCYHEVGVTDSALADFNSAIQLKPDYANAYNNLGVISLNSGNLEQAQKYFEKVIALTPQNGMAHGNLAVVYHQRKEYFKAAEQYEEAHRFNPTDRNIINNAYQLYKTLGDTAKAGFYFRKTISD